MEIAYIIMLGLLVSGAVGLVLLRRAAEAAEARYQQLLEQHPEYRDDHAAQQTSKHLFE
jgi:hypothetical protein